MSVLHPIGFRIYLDVLKALEKTIDFPTLEDMGQLADVRIVLDANSVQSFSITITTMPKNQKMIDTLIATFIKGTKWEIMDEHKTRDKYEIVLQISGVH